MVKTEGIRKAFGPLEVLKGIDLTVNEGEVVALVGASGAGKSTLLHIIGTLDTADAGAVWIGGERTDKLRSGALAKFRNRHIGFVFQFHHLLPEFTALENVCIPGYLGGRPDREVRGKALELMDYLGLADRATHKPSQLSGGEQQRVAVARALVNNPRVVLADEPSGNLDSARALELHQLFFKLRDQFRHTFVIATHNEQLATMSDRRLRISDGIITEH